MRRQLIGLSLAKWAIFAHVAHWRRQLPEIKSSLFSTSPGLWKPCSVSALIRFGRLAGRSDAMPSLPSCAKFYIGWQAGIDQALGLGNRPSVETSNAGHERVHIGVEIGVGKRTIHIRHTSRPARQIHLPELSRTSIARLRPMRLWQTSHRAAAGDHTHAYLPLRNNRLFSLLREPHITGEEKLAPIAGSAAADQGYGCDRRTGQAYQESLAIAVVRSDQVARALISSSPAFEIGVIEEEAIYLAVEHNNPDIRCRPQSY